MEENFKVKLISNIVTKLKGPESNYLPRSFFSISELMHYLTRQTRRKIVPDKNTRRVRIVTVEVRSVKKLLCEIEN